MMWNMQNQTWAGRWYMVCELSWGVPWIHPCRSRLWCLGRECTRHKLVSWACHIIFAWSSISFSPNIDFVSSINASKLGFIHLKLCSGPPFFLCVHMGFFTQYYMSTTYEILVLQEFWDWSWEELALHDLAEMISYVYSKTNSKVFYVGHSQVYNIVSPSLPLESYFHWWGTWLKFDMLHISLNFFYSCIIFLIGRELLWLWLLSRCLIQCKWLRLPHYFVPYLI